MATQRSFTQESSWLHTWMGLLTGWLLVPIFLTGSICVFWHEISAWARPESHDTNMPERPAMVAGSVNYLSRQAPNARLWRIDLPFADNRDPVWTISWTDAAGKTERIQLIPHGDGKPDNARPLVTESKGGRLFVDFHWSLHPYSYRQPDILYAGALIVAAVGISFLVLAITGVVVHKRIFKDFFVFRPGAKSGQRKWLDAHNVLGVLPFPFHVFIAFTGLAYFSFLYAPSGLDTFYDGNRTSLIDDLGYERYLSTKGVPRGAPQSMMSINGMVEKAEASFGRGSINTIVIRDPGRTNAVVDMVRRYDDRIALSIKQRMAFDGNTGRLIRTITGDLPMRTTWDITSSLHFAYFGGAAMRWLYLICGLAGTAMMATGLILFTVKREEKARPEEKGFFRLAERINIVTIAGSAVACAAYMWGVRLLPMQLANRAEWEVHLFLIAWGVTALHAFVRSPRRAWIEQLSVAASLCIGLPLLGFLTPNSALPAMIAAGDWNTAGVDLTALVLGLILATTVFVISGRHVPLQLARSAPIAAG